MAVLRSYKDFEMSVSQIIPENVIPESPEATSLDVAPAKSDAHRRMPFNLKKIARTAGLGLLIASLFGSVTTIVIMAGKISDLSIRVNSLDAAFRSGQISQLSGTVSTLEKKSVKYGTQIESLSSGLLSATNKMAAYQDNLSAFSGTLNDVSSEEQAQRTALDGHSERIDAMNTRLSQLEERVTGMLKAESNNAQNTRKQAQQPVTKGKIPANPVTGQNAKKPERSVRRAAVEAPFVLTGIERRGGQMFVVVIPRGNTQISAMRLLSPGDGMQGWTLRTIRDGNAVFSVNGAEQSLQVQ
ncbi:plasmid transfer protein [Enterobacter sp. JJBC]|uniref:plasmid transfer protein n=1 Tax=Enterobacter sp. JJBC TaxID=3080020 RepID=UPI0030D4E654